ncbi:helix-turn-helix domain-containing protein [Fluviibacter phosphoraccumulans]|jgi:putative transcriptional regulator|uniref:Transcriptional regulator n=1 Tax=Fluviibacter phosphoraccumulans TaxID=1751046 RepID=A0A7R6TNX8_9RHOO|nr:DNA-binding transcriptional regulator [Fluviibacter phosphoraccumulans]BBU69025.1 transcriptional regulator [Fluviibacter phosphoraccumulans]BBU71808.1 transcriptional regulator [Fluviibacter phosphoraccumulans]
MSKIVKTAKNKPRSAIMEAVHEGASDLYSMGFIDKRRMQEYDALCLEPIPDYDSLEIKRIRMKLNLSQPVFAAVLNTTLSTVVQWEGGKKHPRGTSLKLLNLVDRKGLEAVL